MPEDAEADNAPVLKIERAPILVRDIFEAKGYSELAVPLEQSDRYHF